MKNKSKYLTQNPPFCKTDVSGSVVTEVRKRKLGEYEFHCSKCNTIHQMSSYAIAQRTMGHELIFTCTCGNKIDL
jgi:hypothetical protein